MMDILNFNNHIKAFARTISEQQLGIVPHIPESEAVQKMFFQNVHNKIEQDGGKICYGWIFLARSAINIPDGDYLIAEHHAVWYSI